MVAQQRIVSLQQHHAQLEHEIGEEQKRPYPDFLSIKRMKLRKLAIKQEISHLLSITSSSSLPTQNRSGIKKPTAVAVS